MPGRERNLEIKAIDPDPQATLQAALSFGAEDQGVTAQRDTYFHAVTGRLKLREAPPRPAELIAYARAELAGPKVSHYRIVPVADHLALIDALTDSLGVRCVVEKARRLLRWRNVRIHLDRVAGLGDFVELEAIATTPGGLEIERDKVEQLRARARHRRRAPRRPRLRRPHAMSTLAGRTILMSGGSRGIGLAIALRAARDGANVALLAKTAEPHPRLEGTVFTAAEAIEAAGGRALAIVGDVRDDDAVAAAVAQTSEQFGAIDIVVNNASAIDVTPSSAIAMKRYDLMQDVNARGTFLLSRAAVPYLEQSDNPHVLTLSPPLSLDPKWFAPHLAYTLAKFGMSMCTLGMAAEYADAGIAFNSLWPRTLIATAAVQNLLGGDAAMARSRRPEIVADAAHHILTRPAHTTTGNFFIDDEVLAAAGVHDLSGYAYVEDADLQIDLFLDG